MAEAICSAEGVAQHVYEGHSGRIFSLALCSHPVDGRRIAASGSHDRTVRVWCLDTQQHLLTIDYSDFVWRVFLVVGSAGKPLVVAFVSAEERIVVSNAETGETVNDFKGRLVFAGLIPLFDRPVVLLASGEEDLEFIDVETGVEMRKIEGGFNKVFRAVVSHDEACPIMVYTTWNAQNRRSTIQTYDLGGPCYPVAIADALPSTSTSTSSPPKSAVVPAAAASSSSSGPGSPGKAGVTDARSAPSSPKHAAGAAAADKTDASDTPGAAGVCASDSSSELKSDAKAADLLLCEGRMHIMFEGDSKDGVTSLAVSRAKQPVIVSGHYDFVVRVWDLLSRKQLYTLEDHKDWVVSVALWKGAEAMAVSGSSDGTIKLWDLQHGKLLTTCEGHLRDVWSVTVTEGKRPLIVSASVDRTMRSWDISHFLLDLKWSRRRAFCVFLTGCGFLVSDGCKTAVASSGDAGETRAVDASAAAGAGDGVEPPPAAAAAAAGDCDSATAALSLLSLRPPDASDVVPPSPPVFIKTAHDNDPSAPTGPRALRTVFQTTFLCSEVASFL